LAKEIKSTELSNGFEKLKDNYFWQLYQDRILTEFNRVETALISNASADADQLRVCAALMSAFRTVLDLPTKMVGDAQAEEELERLNKNGD
tara:strand:- start:236 stop:508 length:273 start_codon:yes stop_codon:yes gene_type:complete